jgi:hypothetical protein
MPHDAHRVADTRGWLLKAADDLRGAEIDLAAVPPLTGDAAFHCQQAAEKALKALEPLCRRAERLSTFAWIFRYPGDLEDPPVEEVVEALVVARDVHNAVIARLPAEVWRRA